MATATQRTIVVPDLSKPTVGKPTLISFFDGDHTVRLSIAQVLAVGPNDESTGKPTLSVCYPLEPADERKLASVRWADGFARVTGVQHFTHPDVRSGKLSIAWGGDGELEIEGAPEIPQPEGNAENPIFARQELTDQPSTAAVQAEAIAVQHGKAPEGSHASPLTSEAGQTHDATVGPAVVTGATTDTPVVDVAAAEAAPAEAAVEPDSPRQN